MFQGIMVELLLLQKEGDGFVTNFWNEYKFEWSVHYFTVVAVLTGVVLRVAAPATLLLYREKFEEIDRARGAYLGR